MKDFRNFKKTSITNLMIIKEEFSNYLNMKILEQCTIDPPPGMSEIESYLKIKNRMKNRKDEK